MEVPQVATTPISANVPDAEQQQTPPTTPAHDNAAPKSGSASYILLAAAYSTPAHGQNLQPIFEQEEDEDIEEE